MQMNQKGNLGYLSCPSATSQCALQAAPLGAGWKEGFPVVQIEFFSPVPRTLLGSLNLFGTFSKRM